MSGRQIWKYKTVKLLRKNTKHYWEILAGRLWV